MQVAVKDSNVEAAIREMDLSEFTIFSDIHEGLRELYGSVGLFLKNWER